MALLLVALLPGAARADARRGEQKAQICLVCHKPANATAPLANMPLLEAQPARYLYLQIKAYQDKRRPDPVMQTNVAALTDRDMRDIAEYFTGQKLRGVFRLDPAKIEIGKSNATACTSCHRPSFHGADDVPRLAGQTPGYLVAQLETFIAGKRPHGAAPAMTLTESEIEGLAHFLASLD